MMFRVLILFVFLAAPAHAVHPPNRVQINFAVKAGTMYLGEGRDVLEHDGKRYSVVSESKTVGIAAFFYKMNIRRQSRGTITDGGLRSLHFEEVRSRKPPRAAEFNWDANLVKLTDGGSVETVPLPENTFDQTTFTYAFSFQPPGFDIKPVHLTDGRKLTEYKYKILGREKLKTPLGELDTLHFQKVREGDDKRGFEVWLSAQHYYLPVQIRFVEKDGTVLDSTVTAISYQ